MIGRLALGLMVLVGLGGTVQAEDLVRGSGETNLAFAERALHLTESNSPNVVAAAWNGTPTLFVDYQITRGDETIRPLVALMHQQEDHYLLVRVTEGEEEGYVAKFKAIGFANADHGGSKALIVIIDWYQNHHDLLAGDLYEVRLFPAPSPGQDQLAPLQISGHFGVGCECWHNDRGPKDRPYATHFRYKTIAAVKAELKRMGY